MAIVATFTVPTDAFPIGRVFETVPDLAIELERVVPVETGAVPFFWVHGATSDDVLEAFADNPGVRDVTVVESFDDEHLLRVSWNPDEVGLLQAILRSRVTLLSGAGDATEWAFEIRAEDPAQIHEFRRTCREHGVPLDLTLLHSALPVELDDVPGLTEKQREALVLAYRRGYFDSPRSASLEDLASELGISGQALASRVRRGLRHLVGNTLDVRDPDR